MVLCNKVYNYYIKKKSFCKIPNILNFDRSHCMIKAGHFYTYYLVNDDGNVKILGSLCHLCIAKPARLPIMEQTLSLVTGTSFSRSTFFSIADLFTSLEVPTPLVVVFRGSSVRSSSFVENHQTTLG